jgi:hypothetical protein
LVTVTKSYIAHPRRAEHIDPGDVHSPNLLKPVSTESGEHRPSAVTGDEYLSVSIAGLASYLASDALVNEP